MSAVQLTVSCAVADWAVNHKIFAPPRYRVFVNRELFSEYECKAQSEQYRITVNFAPGPINTITIQPCLCNPAQAKFRIDQVNVISKDLTTAAVGHQAVTLHSA